MTPAARDALIARAKQLAVPVASRVAASVTLASLLGDATRDELLALVIVLAEAADPVRLRAVAATADDGPDAADIDVMARKAREEAA